MRALRQRIAELNLSDFLANISEIEVKHRDNIEKEVTTAAQDSKGTSHHTDPSTPPDNMADPNSSIGLSQVQPVDTGRKQSENALESLYHTPPNTSATSEPEKLDFVSRTQIARHLYTIATKFGPERGIELRWLGMGTWETPEIIPEQHVKAWALSDQNRRDKQPETLEKILDETRLLELVRLINEIPIQRFDTLNRRKLTSEEIKKELLIAYRDKLRTALNNYREHGEQPPEDLDKALQYLGRLSVRYL
jgi:hypothetical protein